MIETGQEYMVTLKIFMAMSGKNFTKIGSLEAKI